MMEALWHFRARFSAGAEDWGYDEGSLEHYLYYDLGAELAVHGITAHRVDEERETDRGRRAFELSDEGRAFLQWYALTKRSPELPK